MATQAVDSKQVRAELLDALRLDLIGPDAALGDPNEVLDQAPTRWYLTGFLAPQSAVAADRSDETAQEEFNLDAGDRDDDTPDTVPGRDKIFPSSIGLSVIVPGNCETLQVDASWGDYTHSDGDHWARRPGHKPIPLAIPAATRQPMLSRVPESNGLKIALSVRAIPERFGLGHGTRVASIFLVNQRKPESDPLRRDTAFAFQAALTITAAGGFVPRPDLHGLVADANAPGDWDDRVADLQYRGTTEYAVGHNVATTATVVGDVCRQVATAWVPSAEVERVDVEKIPGVELSMDVLASLDAAADLARALQPLATQYRAWIAEQAAAPGLEAKRARTLDDLVHRARRAADRIEQGIAALADANCREAFRTANRAMATAARRRLKIEHPEWRPFQLAFILLNLSGIADPSNPDREVVDLLFFPTGGGKTEAYLGLAAFTLVLRRLRNPGPASAGVSVLMRYTLRLLTLDQLGRAATVICALELERRGDVTRLGTWPFEIGLWVGRAATPNQMGGVNENNPDSARARTIAYKGNDRKAAPIPLEVCPWCSAKFTPQSFRLSPDAKQPTDLLIGCSDPTCEFGRGQHLPIVAVDEVIYRRLPCFLIATVDKFAALPWTGRVGAFFGRVERYDRDGFYGACDPERGAYLPVKSLPPPELIIQDELHLISGPLGTLAGLYESAIEWLSRLPDGCRPKIIASTATVRRAETQIRALFNRDQAEVFPPPGPDRRNSFFARTVPAAESAARLYCGVAAPGRSPKVALLRVYLALLTAAEKRYQQHPKSEANPADPYMTVLGYFNSLRELGSARRLIADEVRNRAQGYGDRLRSGKTTGTFVARGIDYEPRELTSRVDTATVAETKRRLSLPFSSKDHVDVAIATNMISVGLDITRLGLIVVFGQPKTTAEYIQATSRVGREPKKPGLVVTIFNVHRPRDRSHYERFEHFHATFYRAVEASSVTPFSPRALDRGLAATLVGLARHGHPPMTPPRAASQVLEERERLNFVADVLAERAASHDKLAPEDRERMRQRVRQRATALLDLWAKLAQRHRDATAGLQYNRVEAPGTPPLLYDFLEDIPPGDASPRFRANRSLRDVEPTVALWLKTLQNSDLEPEEAD